MSGCGDNGQSVWMVISEKGHGGLGQEGAHSEERRDVSEIGPAGKSGGVSWQAEFVSRLMAGSDFVLGRLP